MVVILEPVVPAAVGRRFVEQVTVQIVLRTVDLAVADQSAGQAPGGVWAVKLARIRLLVLQNVPLEVEMSLRRRGTQLDVGVARRERRHELAVAGRAGTKAALLTRWPVAQETDHEVVGLAIVADAQTAKTIVN